MAARYVGILKVIRVDQGEPQPYKGSGGVQPKVETEVASIVIRDSSMLGLRERLVSHMELVEE